MKRIIWYAHFVAIERNGNTHTYALRQVSFASMRRLWAVRDRCKSHETDRYKTVYAWS
jgi:hypothetical protein